MVNVIQGRWRAALIFMLAAPAVPGQVTVQVGLNFTGSSYLTNSQALPPDPNGVIGPGRFMEFVNGSVAVYNWTNGASVQRKSDLKFWADAGLNVSAIAVSDPRVIYDPTVQRWFAPQADHRVLTKASGPRKSPSSRSRRHPCSPSSGGNQCHGFLAALRLQLPARLRSGACPAGDVVGRHPAIRHQRPANQRDPSAHRQCQFLPAAKITAGWEP